MRFRHAQFIRNATQFLMAFGMSIPLLAQAQPSSAIGGPEIASGMALVAFLGGSLYALSKLRVKPIADATQPIQNEDVIARHLIYGATDSIFVINEEGIIQSANPAAQRMFGYLEGDIRGQNIATLIPPPDRGRRRANYIQNPGSHELFAIQKTGDRIPIESSFSEIVLGEKKLYSLVIRDISETRKKQELVNFQQNLLTEILVNAGFMLFVVDRNGTIVHFNRACENVTDFSFGEIKNQKIWDVVAAPADSEAMREQVAQWFDGPFPLQQNSTWTSRDYTRKPIAWTYTALNDSFGHPNYIIGTGYLLSEQQMTSQALQSQKMEAVSRFAGGLARDFSNLLTAITGYSSLLLGSLEDTNPIRKDVEEIKKASDHGVKITRQLLAVSRHQVLQPKDFDLNDVLKDMEMLLRRILGNRIAVEFDLAQPDAVIHADQGQIEQVIINIVVNARDAMPHGGKLSIATNLYSIPHADTNLNPNLQAGSYCGIRITDSGMGMDEQTQQHIFEPFFTTKRSAGAAGMGLATVYGVIRQSEGSISVVSEPNGGSSFLIYLPSAEAIQHRKLPEKTVLKIVPTGSETILVVEGDERIRATVAKGLARFGYRILEAVSGAEAKEMSHNWEGKIHILVADALMPSVGGPDLARAIRMQRPETKVLYISAEAEEKVIRYGLSTSNTYLLADTFNAEHFAEKVRQILDTKTMSAGMS